MANKLKNDSKMSKNLLNFVLEVHENAEMYDKMDILFGLLEFENNNEDIANMLEELGYCSCGSKLEERQTNEMHEFWGVNAKENLITYKCPDCGYKNT